MLADHEAHTERPGSGDPFPFSRAIHLENVSYTHPGGRGLSRISAVLPANTTIAITGPSGSGKTTLADVLLGLLTPHTGVVRIDDAVLDADTSARWRSRVGYVPQDPFLFHGTVRENLAWGNDGLSEERLRKALRLAAADFVDNLPEGPDTIVGDKGGRLSGGERQRLILARALLGNPQVLVLDEATSALDTGNERAIHAALKGLHNKLTIVVITHKPETLDLADQILRLEGGQSISADEEKAMALSTSPFSISQQVPSQYSPPRRPENLPRARRRSPRAARKPPRRRDPTPRPAS
jgi:ATP-binding cassette subfamily C protein